MWRFGCGFGWVFHGIFPPPAALGLRPGGDSATVGGSAGDGLVVAGGSGFSCSRECLSKDASDDSDSGEPCLMEPIEEESERCPKDSCCPSPIGDSDASKVAMDEAANELDDLNDDLEPIPGVPLMASALGLQEGLRPLDSVHTLHPVNPNSSIPLKDNDYLGGLNTKPQDAFVNAIAISTILAESSCPQEKECSSFMPAEIENAEHENLMESPNARTANNFKGKWSNLFSDNRKPIEDFMLKKVIKKSSNIDSAQHIWKPKTCKKLFTWQRVPVPNKKAQDPGDTQNCKIPVPPQVPSTDRGLTHSCAPPVQAHNLISEDDHPVCTPSSSQSSPKHASDSSQHDKPLHHPDGLQQGNDAEEFQSAWCVVLPAALDNYWATYAITVSEKWAELLLEFSGLHWLKSCNAARCCSWLNLDGLLHDGPARELLVAVADTRYLLLMGCIALLSGS
ncbi:hypothetical protein Dimus_028785 [Dionaea muscipula]